MQKKYPENIADIEKYYQESLEGISIEPPTAVWDRIESALDQNKKPKGFFYFFTKRNLFLASALFIALGLTGYYFLNEKNTPSENQSIEKEFSGIIPDSTYNEKENESKPPQNDSKVKGDKKDQLNKENSVEQKSEATTVMPHSNVDSSTFKQPEIVNSTEPKQEPVETKEVKEKVSFKEKYKKKYQDSTRQIFVPETK